MAKKQNLSYQDIETSLEIFKERQIPSSEVSYCMLRAFGKSDADIRRYKEGKGVLASYNGLLIKGLFCYKESSTMAMTSTLEDMMCDPQVIKAAPKIIAVSDGTSILAYDMREHETYENPLDRLYCDFAFFYPLCGVERFVLADESPADVKAAEKLAKLHDELRAYNDFSSKSELHDLNIFIARLLFCFFAEDTGIFEDNLFTGSIVRYTKEDGSDLADYLSAAFNVMNIRERNADTMKIISQFPYVNGGLFSKHIQIPNMGFKARKIIIECGELNWQDINPDIFGSMIQAVVDPNVRANQGMHYTSVPNIMKVINPLFLDELREEYNALNEEYLHNKQMRDIGGITFREYSTKCQSIIRRSNHLLARISKMKFFDPACGSGNFLIITYKSLRFLEMDLLKLQQQCKGEERLKAIIGSVIKLEQFYGIELLDFPHEVAMLSMWLAQHQMNKKFFENFGVNTKALPLLNITQIQCGNACRLDWNVVCPHTKEDEVFVFGNPPYLGYSKQSKAQKNDIELVCGNLDGYGKLDYISCWFINGIKYINNTMSQFAFVTTNSISQGEQVSLLWKHILTKQEISFAYKSFMWKNNAKDNAMVAVTIIGIRNINKSNNKKIYDNNTYRIVSNISPYLIEGENVFICPIHQSISDFPEMIKGCSPVDDGNLLLDEKEKQSLEKKYPQLKSYIKKYIGADEFVNGKTRYCLWFSENTPKAILNCVKERLERVADFRANSTKASTRNFSNTPQLFIERKYSQRKTIVVPQTGSEKRKYLPMGIADENTVLSNAVRIVNCDNDYYLDLWGIIASEIHMVWVRAVAGRMKTDMQYSNTICYNTFPFPKITDSKREQLKEAAEEVLLARADHPEKTLAEMYDPDKMPQNLREAHAALDDVVDSCYPDYPFANDEARLECLFKLYEKMTSK